MTTEIWITFVIGLILLLLISFIDENEFRFGATLIGIIILVGIVFILSTDTEIPKYNINDKVQLPDITWGNIDSVAYKIKGVWYNQEVLKD